MNRIVQLFEKKKKDILSIYFTAGFPELNDTVKILTSLENHGVDFVEIGIPFSDPVADGEVIQQSSTKALKNGMNLNLLFEQLKDVRKISGMPVLLMTYLNPVFNMGIETFLKKCYDTGIDGLIIPDFPPEEYRDKYKSMFKDTGMANILLITPQTPDERIREIDDLSEGFIYMVSSYSTTGARDEFSEAQLEYFKRVNNLNLKNPLITGFGISNNKTFKQACSYSAGAIVGSAFVRELHDFGFDDQRIESFIGRIVGSRQFGQ